MAPSTATKKTLARRPDQCATCAVAWVRGSRARTGRLRVRGRFSRLADELTEQDRHLLHVRLADPDTEHVLIVDPRPSIRATAAIQNTYALSLLQAETLAVAVAKDWSVRFLDPLTVGATTAKIWTRLHEEWSTGRQLGPWVFSGSRDHGRPITPGALGHRVARLRAAAGVPDAPLTRLRHNVATFLVRRGDILGAQARLGHRDAATTLREYSYALPGSDTAIADAIDLHLNEPQHSPDPSLDEADT